MTYWIIQFETLYSIDDLSTQYYDAVDDSPSLGINYYRIRAMSDNGSLTYSNITSVNIKRQSERSVQLYPIPANDYIQLDGMECVDCSIKLYNSEYRKIDIEKSTLDGGKIKLNIEHLLPGFYLLHIEGKENEVLKFVKI